MTPVKNGVVVEMEYPSGGPYYKVSGDRYQCHSCRRTILTGFGSEVLAESYEDQYANYEANVVARFAQGV
jgi:hypothetical protein